MSKDIYTLNKSIDRPLIFKGLKAQYIYYYLGLLVLSFIVFAVLNSSGLHTGLTLIIIVSIVIVGVKIITHISDKFGINGLKKYFAKSKIPNHIKVESRSYFFKQIKNNNG